MLVNNPSAEVALDPVEAAQPKALKPQITPLPWEKQDPDPVLNTTSMATNRSPSQGKERDSEFASQGTQSAHALISTSKEIGVATGVL